MSLLELRGVSRAFTGPSGPVHALRDVCLTIERGEFLAIIGPSGGGKSTLLSILGGLDVPSSGEYVIDGEPAPRMEGRELAGLRARTFGFIFQSFHLLEQRPGRDSVELGMLYQGVPRAERSARARRAAERVGMGGLLEQRTVTLSGGQRQRLAIARAIATESEVLLADEPTGNLDSATGAQVMSEISALHRAGMTVVIVTHSAEVAAAADRVVEIIDGTLHAVSGSARPRVPAVTGPTRATAPLTRTRRFRGTGAVDTIRDAAASLVSRKRSSLALAGTVALAVALLVTTLGLMGSTRAQVTSTFDAHENRQVAVTWPVDEPGADRLDAVAVARGIAGVAAAVQLTTFAEVGVGNPREPGRTVAVHEGNGDLAAAADAEIVWAAAPELSQGQALIGQALAEQLELGPLLGSPAIMIGDRAYTVRGIIVSSERKPQLNGEVVLAPGDAPPTLAASQHSLLVETTAGAAAQVGRLLPLALDPYAPELFDVRVPTDPRDLRAQVESGVQVALFAFTAVAGLIAVLTLMNSIGAAVTARRSELGLRRALGAGSGRLAGLVVTESAILGAAGGAGGLVLGLAAILGFTIAQHWVPVFDLRLAPLAVVGGMLVGAIASVVGAIRAARIRPAEALRQ